MSGLLLVGVALLLLGSALISAAESAVFSVGASRLRTLVDEGFSGAGRLQEARAGAVSIQATTFLASSALNLTAAGLIVAAITLQWGLSALLWAVPVATIIVLLASEGIPRIIAVRHSLRLALFSAPLLLRLERGMRPLIAPFRRLDDVVRRGGTEESSAEERELRELTELGRKEGVLEEEEHELVERAFRMDELTAWDIMTPRVDIFAWKASLTVEEAVRQLRNVPHSRVPIYGESIDDITGVLSIRAAYEAYVAGERTLTLGELAREPFFVPGSLALPRLLKDFQVRRIHMGIVADEFGGTDGLVTLEDVIEELVGEIEDETDVAEDAILRISRHEAEVEGGTDLREVNYAFNVSLPYLEHRSLNGFILEEMGRVPAQGERMEFPGLEIEVLEATDTQVVRALLRKTHPVPSDEG